MPIYLGKVSTWLEKRFNAKGSPFVQDMEPAVRTVLPWPVGVEDRALQGWNRFAANLTAAAIAAQNSAVRIRNPVGSNVIVVIENVIATQQSVVTRSQLSLQYGTVSADLANIGSATGLDSRQNQGSAMILSQGQAGQLTSILTANVSGTPVQYIITTDQEIALLPGVALEVTDITVNEAVTVSFQWRERGLELSELT